MSRDNEPLPPYTYVPGGPWPHPISGAGGHWAAGAPPRPEPIAQGRWEDSGAYRRGAALFNAGYYWEAHEVWEGLWHAHGRRGPVAELLKALIKLAAAGVKVREGQPRGVSTHCGRAARIFESLQTEVGGRFLGFDLEELAATARNLAADPPRDPAPAGAAVSLVFGFRLQPR